jgi:hypothetical protein
LNFKENPRAMSYLMDGDLTAVLSLTSQGHAVHDQISPAVIQNLEISLK